MCRRRSLPLSGLTNAQLAEHYADCIKLSTENVRTQCQQAVEYKHQSAAVKLLIHHSN